MANKVVNLTIKLKDGVTGVLKGIRSGIGKVTAAFKKLAVIGVATTTAIIGGLTALAKAWSDQESVNNKLKASFDAVGESGSKAVLKWGAWATSIQRVTALGDEEIMGLVALAKIMGVTNDRIEEATKGAIGLSKAFGIDLNSSMKMVALAFNGEYTMLNRYIPALRAANNETEKAAILQSAMANGFKLATAELGTIKGQMAALKGVIGDVWQEVGRVFFGGESLAKGIENVKQKIIDLTESGAITRWAEQAKAAFDQVKAAAQIILGQGPEGARAELFGKIATLLRAAIMDAADYGAAVLSAVLTPTFTEGAKRIGTEIVEQAKKLADWGWTFIKDLGSMLISVAPDIGDLIGRGVINAAKKISDRNIAKGEAGKRAREDLGPRPSGSLFPDEGQKEETKKYYDALDKLTEKYYQENLATLKKKADEQKIELVKAFLSSFKKPKQEENAPHEFELPPLYIPPGAKIETPKIKDDPELSGLDALKSKIKDSLEKIAEEWDGGGKRSKKALDDLNAMIEANKPSQPDDKPVDDVNDAMEKAPSFITKFTDSLQTAADFIKKKEGPFVDKLGGAVGDPDSSQGLTDQERAQSEAMGGINSKMMGMAKLGSKMMGAGTSSDNTSPSGMAGTFGGSKMMGTDPEAAALADDLKKAIKEAKEEDPTMDAAKNADSVEGKLDAIYTILNERLGGVSGG